MAPTTPKRLRASRLQTRRQSFPSWVAENPSWEVGLTPLSPVSCGSENEPAMRHRGRHIRGAATMAIAQGAIHHQLMPCLPEFTPELSRLSDFASWVPTTDPFYSDGASIVRVVFPLTL